MWRSRWRCVIKPAHSFSFLLSINIFVWQNVLYFLDAPRSTFTIHIPNLITVEWLSFIRSHFTTNAQYFLHLNQGTHGHIRPLSGMPFQRSWDGCEWLGKHQKCVCDLPLDFQFELNTQGFLSIPTYENLKDWGGELLGGCALKLFVEVYWQELVSLFWCGELTPEFVQAFS